MKTNTWAQLAEILGVARQTLTRWRKRPDAPSTPDVEIWQSYIETRGLGPYRVEADSPLTKKLRSEKLRKEIALLDLRLARERACVIPVDQVAELLKRIAAGQKKELLAWAETHRPKVRPGADLAEIRQGQLAAAYALCDQMETGLARWLTPATTTAPS